MQTHSKPANAVSHKTPCGRVLPVTNLSAAEHNALMRTMKSRMDAYTSLHKLKHSDVRRKILETIVAEANHFTSIDLLERVQQRYPDVSRATLYRTLPMFVESGILEEGPTDSNGLPLYELARGDHHDHIVCLDCKHIFEFHDDLIEQQQERVAANLKFAPTGHRHVIFARCEMLADAKTNARGLQNKETKLLPKKSNKPKRS